jgi:protein-glutamine gamma-glutamyltransferase
MLPASSAHPGSSNLPASIERYFQVSLYLMVLTGFGTLASTAALDLPTVALVGMALLVRGVLLAKRTEMQLPERWVTYLTLGYGVFYVADLTTFSGNFLTATVRLALFGMVIRIFSVQKDRDHYMLAILSFLMILAATVLTVDSVFLFAFAGFALMAVATFVLMEMRRSVRSATVPVRDQGDQPVHRRMAFFLAGASPVLVLLIMLGACAIFFLLPRMSAGYLSSYATGADMATGFSDRVQLGRIGQIQQSSAVVMHIQIDGDTRGAYDLKWRGIALSAFDGKSWSNPSEQYTLSRQGDGRFFLWPAQSGLRKGHRIHYRVLMEPVGTSVFFLASRPQYISGNYRSVATDRNDAVYDLDPLHPISLYDAESDLSEPTSSELRKAGGVYPPEFALTYLLVRSVDPRIPQLARQITAPAANNYDRAAALEHYLMTNFGYTLQLPRMAPKDPLADFLFQRKQGHCEYFASSMAVMLRTLGIPSRVVNGFRTTEFNDLTSTYVIRASSAHSWVEAYFPGYGWISFDPTPASPPITETGWNRMMLYLDALASFWREWVINYDASHQRTLGENAIRGSRTMVERSRQWVQEHYDGLLSKARKLNGQMAQAPRRWALSAVGLLIALLLLVNTRNLLGWISRRKLRAHPEKAPAQAASLWFDRLTRRLGTQGWRKSTSETPREWLRKIDDVPLRQRVEKFTEAYECARFGNDAEQARRLPELYEEVAEAERSA